MPASVILAIGSLAIMTCLTALSFVLALLSGQILILAAVSVALGRKCPSCEHYTNAGANFLFTKA